MKDYVVLVNDHNKVLGTAEKVSVHNGHTPLHRGFSVFLFDEKGNLLVQQRSHKKKTFPLVWSNSCCGHPKLDETAIEAARRRLLYELGIHNVEVTMMLPDYRYRFHHKGIYENEFCPVMVAKTKEKQKIHPDEVEAVQWISWRDWLKEIKTNPKKYSPWSVEQTQLLKKIYEPEKL